jgi:hypothetical protein
MLQQQCLITTAPPFVANYISSKHVIAMSAGD